MKQIRLCILIIKLLRLDIKLLVLGFPTGIYMKELDSVGIGRRKLTKGALPNGLNTSLNNENDKRLLTSSIVNTRAA